ncbi:membrane-bound lytic murein transglycosylase MltF [Marinobacter sp. C2H3]|uniref:membrane-bound lytic murein transglycosylase MltF n=1 Tax=Marinobacter sp. C2H3 TaxID=3119003 RepID=UPI00300F242A
MANPLRIFQTARRTAGLLVAVALVATLGGCARPSSLQEIRDEGTLHVITRTAPSIYYQGRNGPTGYDYELAKRLADSLGVHLRIREAEDNTEILSVLDNGYAHIGMAGLSDRPSFHDRFQTLPTGIETQSVVVYRRGDERPDSLDDLAGQTLHAVAGSDHKEVLSRLGAFDQGVTLASHPGLDPAGILDRVDKGDFKLAIVSSNELELNRVFFPKVNVAFTVGKPRPLVWLFPKDQDNTLISAARALIDRMKARGELAQLSERFYGHLDQLNYVGARTFMYHVENRLPQYEDLFKAQARDVNMDWRLLAAIGYQESHWRPNAKSPTGVRGLMMLTRTTASSLGINDRLDVKESIEGGARYFQVVHDKIPERIPEPDRTWFALASYNVGFGHLEDARRLAEGAGKNPDRWIDVKEFLPLLSQKAWYSRTRFGYARGQEPVLYVQNIRRYYDVLARLRRPVQPTPEEPTPRLAGDGEPPASEGTTTAETDNEVSTELRASLPPDLAVIPPTL